MSLVTDYMGNASIILSDDQLREAILSAQANVLLRDSGIINVTTLLLSTSICCVVQAIIAGSCFQLVYQYFYQPKRDPLLARLGVILIVLLSVFQVVICDVQMIRLIQHFRRFTGGYLRDWYIYNIQWLLFQFILAPILFFFTHRAYVIWDRSKWVLFSCVVLVVPIFALNTTSACFGLKAPWGSKVLSNEEFAYWIPVYLAQTNEMYHVDLASTACHTAVTVLLCFYICYGLLRHKNGFEQMDTAISRIIFLCGESLVPVVILAIIFLIAAVLVTQPYGQIILRIIPPLAPVIYFHALMSALVARERVATILSAEPVRQMVSLSGSQLKGGGVETARSDVIIDPVNTPRMGTTFNWATLRAESSTFSATPDFVDLSKLSSTPTSGIGTSRSKYSGRSAQTQSQNQIRDVTLEYNLTRRMSLSSLPSDFVSHPNEWAAGVKASRGISGDPLNEEEIGDNVGHRAAIAEDESRRSSASMGFHEFLAGPPIPLRTQPSMVDGARDKNESSTRKGWGNLMR